MTPSALHSALASVVGADFVNVLPVANVVDIGAEFLLISPRTPGEVGAAIALCAARKVAVHPVGAGDRPTPHPRNRDRVFISTVRLDQIVQLDETSLLVHVQAGVTGTQLQEILRPRGLSLGDYPPAVLTATIGGIIAVRTPGKSSARHGFFEDAVVGVSAVLANGKTVHTKVAPRRSTGPDLQRALCGSEGTVGFITSVVLRVHRKPQARFLASYVLPSVDAAIAAVYLALREEAAPSGLRIYDRNEALAHFPSHPTVVALGDSPQTKRCLMVVGTAGPTDLAAVDRDLVSSAVRAESGELADEEIAKAWWRRLHHGESSPAAPPTLQIMASPRKLAATYHAAVEAAVTAGASARAHISRFDADGAVVFLTLRRKGVDVPASSNDVHDVALMELCLRAATQAGGWEPGARAAKLDSYLHSLRESIDPDQIMNPGAL